MALERPAVGRHHGVAEPHLVERKRTGLVVMIFLIVLAGLVYYTKKKVWAYSPGEGAA